MKKLIIILCITAGIAACGGGNKENASTDNSSAEAAGTDSSMMKSNTNPAYDPNRGDGPYKNVEVSPKLNEAMADAGQKIFTVKCSACHKLTSEKLVGPGWKGVTSRHTAEWIMNFATNPDAMLDKDPKAEAMLDICLVRMPNQHLTGDDARNVYEFMRKNDGVK